MARDQDDRADWTAGTMPEPGITKNQTRFWTAVVVVAGSVCVFLLEVHNVIPRWADTAIIAPFILLPVCELERRRKRGEPYSLPSMLLLFLQAAIVTGAAVGLVLSFLAAEGLLRDMLGILTITLVAVGLSQFSRSFPLR